MNQVQAGWRRHPILISARFAEANPGGVSANDLKSFAARNRRVENAILINLHRRRIRAAVFRRHACASLERARERAHTSRQNASRRMRHPIFISFCGQSAHGGDRQKRYFPGAYDRVAGGEFSRARQSSQKSRPAGTSVSTITTRRDNWE